MISKLGQGSYGTVYLVQDTKDGERFVMKKITVSGMSESELSDCKKEIQILSLMNHPNIVRYKRSFVRRGALCIVMEFADGGDLHAKIKANRKAGSHLPEDLILDMFTQTALGLKHVHDQKILHRDLKTQNIFLTSSGDVRLGDFGISRVLKNTMDQAHTLVGTPYYLSPEMVNGQPYDHRSDIWSLGVVLYEMLTLQHPFNADSLQMLALKIIQGEYPPIPRQYSQSVDTLLSLMLEQEASKRLDIEGVLRYPIIFERVKRFMPDCDLVKQSPESSLKTSDYPKQRLSNALDQTKTIPKFSKKKELPPTPAADGTKSIKRRGSVNERLDLEDEEPDWAIGTSVHVSDSQLPMGDPSSFTEPTMAQNTQAQILKSYLEERLSPGKLRRVLECLHSDLSDVEKQSTVEKLTEGHKGLLPIVHTLLYLQKRSS